MRYPYFGIFVGSITASIIIYFITHSLLLMVISPIFGIIITFGIYWIKDNMPYDEVL